MAWISKFSALFRRQKLSAEHDEEMHYHLSRLAEIKTQTGLSAQEARLAARRQFGNPARLKEELGDADVFTFLESFFRDLRFGARMLLKHPSFTVIAAVALSVGIGVNTAVFTAYKAVLLEKLDAKDAASLVNIYRTPAPDQFRPTFSYPDFEFYRDQNHVFSGLIAVTGDELSLSGTDSLGGPRASLSGGGTVAGALGFSFPSLIHGGAEYVSALSVSENYFPTLGVNAFAGRVFTPQDARELDQHPAVLISENYWQRRFGSNVAILGKSIQLNGAAFTIIGITPHDFRGTNINVPNFWLPLRLHPLLYKGDNSLHDREDFCCALYARLAQGINLPQAQAEMTLLAQHVRSLHTPRSDDANNRSGTVTLTPGSHVGTVDSGLTLAILLVMCAAALVLLIACANVASLQLARSAARQREIGTRLSVGASRGRIIRQLLIESALLGLLAGAASVLMAWCALRLLMIEISSSLPMEWGNVALHVEPDAYVFGYVFALSLIAGIMFGLTPALQASRQDLYSAMKEPGARLRNLLVATQVTVSIFLLIAAGLLIRGSMRGTSVNPGYETHNTVWLNVNFPSGFNFTPALQLEEIRELRERVENIPGVQSVTSGNAPDSGGLRNAAIGLDGAKPPAVGPARTLFYSYVSANYFKTLSIPVLSGHPFAADSLSPDPVAVLSESAANELWPGLNPIGRTLTLDATHEFHGGNELMPTGTRLHVIGVAADTAGIIPGNPDSRKVYLSLPTDRIDNFPLLFRANANPQRLLRLVNTQVQTLDPRLVVYAETLDGLMTSTPNFVMSRLAAIFAALIGGLGLFLACVGIYGAVSYAVVRRTREMGIRMALGAQKSDVLRIVLTESSRPVLIGLIIGVLLAAGASRVLRALLYGMSALDPLSFAGISALFFLIALSAAYFPARRATLVDPVVALRCD
jgi:predicted permease